MKTRVPIVATAFIVFLVVLIFGSALLPDGTFKDWGWPAICGLIGSGTYVWLDRRREQVH